MLTGLIPATRRVLRHPLACTGATLLTTLVHERERSRGRFGFQTMCGGFGQRIATLIERL